MVDWFKAMCGGFAQDAGNIHHRINIAEQGKPLPMRGHAPDVTDHILGVRIGLSHCAAHTMAGPPQRSDDKAAKESAGADDQHVAARWH